MTVLTAQELTEQQVGGFPAAVRRASDLVSFLLDGADVSDLPSQYPAPAEEIGAALGWLSSTTAHLAVVRGISPASLVCPGEDRGAKYASEFFTYGHYTCCCDHAASVALVGTARATAAFLARVHGDSAGQVWRSYLSIIGVPARW